MSASVGPGRQGAVWRRLRAECMAHWEAIGAPCSLCGNRIDYEFTRNNPRHRLAGTAHHIIGLAEDGEPADVSNLAPAHLTCNVKEANDLRNARARTRIRPVYDTHTSRRW